MTELKLRRSDDKDTDLKNLQLKLSLDLNITQLKLRVIKELFTKFNLTMDQKLDIAESLDLVENESGVIIVKEMFKERYSKLCKL